MFLTIGICIIIFGGILLPASLAMEDFMPIFFMLGLTIVVFGVFVVMKSPTINREYYKEQSTNQALNHQVQNIPKTTRSELLN